MLRLRVAANDETKSKMIDALDEIPGVSWITADVNEGEHDWVISADLSPHCADAVLDRLHQFNVSDEHYVMVRQELIAPQREPGSTLQTDQDFAWVEVLGSARANSRPIGRYMLLMLVSGAIAAMGVTSGNSILIVGAMAVSPDLLPICATCVALVAKRMSLAFRALATLLVGMGIAMLVAMVLAFFLRQVGILQGGTEAYLAQLGPLVHTDYATVVVALAAGIAGILAFETRAAAAVGVAISITTVPASAYFGVAVGLGDPADGLQALVTLAVNVFFVMFAGTNTLAIQRWLPTRGS